jgi:hypothetical protein
VTSHGPSTNDVEIFYHTDPSSDTLLDDARADPRKLAAELQAFKPIPYKSAIDKEAKIPTTKRRLRLALRFFQESPSNTVNLTFNYSFTQNSDKEANKAIMSQHFKKALKVQSMSPFRLEWEVKNSDPFIQNMRLRNEQLQLAPLVAPLGEEFWIDCTLTSQSASKVIYLSKAFMEIVEREKIKMHRKVDMGNADGKSLVDMQGAAAALSEAEIVRLEPGESYQCVYLLKADPCYFEDLRDHEDGIMADNSIKEIEQFAELNFGWTSHSINTLESAIDSTSGTKIFCTVPSPTLTLINAFLKVSLLNEKDL